MSFLISNTNGVYKLMDESLHYLQHIHKTVINSADIDSSSVSSELCEMVLEKLGLPKVTANPRCQVV